MVIMESHEMNMSIAMQVPLCVALLYHISFRIGCDSTVLFHSGILLRTLVYFSKSYITSVLCFSLSRKHCTTISWTSLQMMTRTKYLKLHLVNLLLLPGRQERMKRLLKGLC